MLQGFRSYRFLEVCTCTAAPSTKGLWSFRILSAEGLIRTRLLSED